ncbi:ESCRT-0 subunit protein hse1 [Agyrium rufum]|nr:ESCRT-0 subunit protein hse1 [Agyrium rufum]
MIKRLAHRNANVQLYTLELANALSQNCGVKIHRELASRSFTDAMIRLANDRNTHNQVKAKILERMGEWTEMFAKEPDLGIMEQAYMRLKSQNPNLHPPSKPTKRQITDVDRQKEEEELQMALALSVKDRGATQPSPAQGKSSGGPSANATPAPTQQAASTPAPSQGTTAATVSRVRALFDFQPSEAGELQFKKGDIIAVLESVYKDWWKGSLRGQTGIFPLNYVEKIADPTPEERVREAQMEAEVFAEIKNVEKLLTLLSTVNTDQMSSRDNDEITKLYHSTLAIRPKLIELIGKYSQRKDDFTQLNERFIKARRDYESLLDISMSQPHYPPSQGPSGYGYPRQGGYPPQQAEPARYYSPAPNDSRPPQSAAIPQNGPAPFYMQNQAQTSSSQQDFHQYPTPRMQQDPRTRTPTGLGRPGPQSQQALPSQQPPSDPYRQDTLPPPQQQAIHHMRPQSTYDQPQELGASNFSPTSTRPISYPPQIQSQQTSVPSQPPGSDGYPPAPQQQLPPPSSAPYPPHDESAPQSHASYPGAVIPPYQQQQQQQQQQQPPYSQQRSPIPQNGSSYAPSSTGSPPPPQQGGGMQGSPYPVLGGAPPGGSGQGKPAYQAYQPGRVVSQGVQQGGGGGAPSDPGDFYR